MALNAQLEFGISIFWSLNKLTITGKAAHYKQPFPFYSRFKKNCN